MSRSRPSGCATALPAGVDADDLEVMVVAPALQENPIKFWFSDADEAIARAEEVRRESIEKLGAGGIQATGDTGESDPMLAIQDALNTFPADRILLFTGGAGLPRGHRRGGDRRALWRPRRPGSVDNFAIDPVFSQAPERWRARTPPSRC